MEKEFVPYELELKLKKLGCNVFLNYVIQDENDPYPTIEKGILFQQAFDWFRDKFKFMIGIGIDDNNLYYTYNIVMLETTKEYYKDCFKTYQEAQLQCLIKLIEIVENN